MKTYCTQNHGNCETCSLVNYGRDCQNQPLQSAAVAPTHKGTRQSRMMASYNGFRGSSTVEAVLAQIPQELQRQLTGKQLGMVMSCVNQAYHNGKAACGCEIIDGDAIWIDPLNALIDLSDIRQLITANK